MSNEINNLGYEPMHAPKSAFMHHDKKHFNKIALIDADRLKHLVAYDVNCDLKQGRQRDPHRLTYHIEERLGEIFRQFSAAGYIFCFSGKSHDTFRAAVAVDKKYKGNRIDREFYEGKIEDMAEVVSYVMKIYPTLIFTDLEADDLLCYLQHDYTFIFSNDKDLNQIPGHHFNVEQRDLMIVTEEQAHRNLCYQMIVGDSTDHIGGLFRYGEKKALKILEEVPLKQMLQRILYEYQVVHGITKGTDCFVETWNLVKLRMHRGEYFHEKYIDAMNLLLLMKQQLGI